MKKIGFSEKFLNFLISAPQAKRAQIQKNEKKLLQKRKKNFEKTAP